MLLLKSASIEGESEMRIDESDLPEEIAKLGLEAWYGSGVTIMRDGQPWLKIVPHDAYRPTPRPGLLKGKFTVPDDFCDTPEDIIEDFYK